MMNRDIHDVFDQVRADEQLKASTQRFLREARRKKSAPLIQTPRFAAVMASLLVCVLCLGGFSYLNAPVSYISIDVNPSIELTLNRLHRVVSAEAFNDDAQIVLENVEVRGMNYTQAIDTLLESTAMQPYLTDNAVLSFTVAAESKKTEAMLLTGIGECAGCRQYRGLCASADGTLIQEAHQKGLSFGKYQVYLALRDEDIDITPEACRSMSMAELRSLMREQNGADNEDNRKHRNRQGARRHRDDDGQEETSP